MKLALVAICSELDARYYALEWIKYHRHIGFDKNANLTKANRKALFAGNGESSLINKNYDFNTNISAI